MAAKYVIPHCHGTSCPAVNAPHTHTHAHTHTHTHTHTYTHTHTHTQTSVGSAREPRCTPARGSVAGREAASRQSSQAAQATSAEERTTQDNKTCGRSRRFERRATQLCDRGNGVTCEGTTQLVSLCKIALSPRASWCWSTCRARTQGESLHTTVKSLAFNANCLHEFASLDSLRFM
jgi:hypothetical protein